MSLRRLIGWILFIISSITLLLVFAVPFTPYTTTEKTALAASLYLASQISWWLCLPFLGKDLLAAMHTLWPRFKKHVSHKGWK